MAQLILEDKHAKEYCGHEVVHQQSYTNEVLDEFTEIIESQGPEVDFHSRVLTPILQCYLWGITNAYGPSVHSAILNTRAEELTIRMVTEFCLSKDPTNSGFIPTYHCNLIYIPEVRWHLGVIMERKSIGGSLAYNGVRIDYNLIMQTLLEDGIAIEDGSVKGDVPKFNI